ncbi:MAG TPA: GH116 family glycosyl hydrolase [Opitutaceae bacterium]|nr:GH116 family glycosyl hydrolase [Opitutaceae bacterium]HRJ46160.1 GH116 family glycosyl hydrolase [Opitutaceae bacterium]
MPVGGLGAGNVCLNGHGGLQDFSIRHRPHTTALPDANEPADAAFALLRIAGRNPMVRLVEGPLPPGRIYDQGLQAQGHRQGGHEGLPRFARAVFEGEFPFGHVLLEDPALPVTARITAFNPFIPLDDRNSGLPCAILEYRFRNRSRRTVQYEFSFHLSHLAAGNGRGESAGTTAIGRTGVHYWNREHALDPAFGSAALLSLGGEAVIKAGWFRGGWFDALTMLWREVATGRFRACSGSPHESRQGRSGGSLLFRGRLAPDAESCHPLVLAWHFPNAGVVSGPGRPFHGEVIRPAPGQPPPWRPYYAGQWPDAPAVARHVRRHYGRLRARTLVFRDALYGSTLPPAVLDAVSANLAILKSPTVLRQENGNLWGWEGCFPDRGCCPGSCTHVWNYAQSLCHLFPALERTLREQELLRSQDRRGHVGFRAALPDGPARHDGPAAADGQLGGIIKLYRDWHISGDTAWLRRLYPHAKRSLRYCIRTWDPDRTGSLVEPHHNTYDIEFWGPDSMGGTIYVAALSAMAAMASALGDRRMARESGDLAERGARLLDLKLFNGEYYHQQVRYRDVRDRTVLQLIDDPRTDPERQRLLDTEGPKYQYGPGCLSDGVLGAWLAWAAGLPLPLNPERVRRTLDAIHRHNFRKDLRDHANTQRPGYAMGSEAGLLLCSWPRGGRPTLPFVYCDEVWTGVEYQVASHLIATGRFRKGLEIVRAVRRRYDGRVRNPYNEYECGSYYARAMASYALLPACSGFRYSALEETLWFGPSVRTRPYAVFFSTATGWGRIVLKRDHLAVHVTEGRLRLRLLVLTLAGREHRLVWNVVIRAGRTARRALRA